MCIRHADVIFLLVDPTKPSTVTSLEESLDAYAPRTRKEMVFLHKEETKYPKNTAEWLRKRASVNTHYHIRCPKRMFFKKQDQKLESMYNKIITSGYPPDIHSDFSRLSRYITGTSIGLVLGGGGARGAAHIGLIKAILESGVPIDHVAGVSIGSLIGGLYCQERDVVNLTVKARGFFNKMAQKWR